MFIEMRDQKLDADEFSMNTEQSPVPPQEETVNNPYRRYTESSGEYMKYKNECGQLPISFQN